MTLKLRLVVFLVLSASCFRCVGAEGTAGSSGTASTREIKDSAELVRMYNADQSDRTPIAGQQIDWKIVGPRDMARKARVMELYAANLVKTGMDYKRAAMLLQHGDKPEDFLLAHEFCVIAIFEGVDARWLAAASEDRFLRSIGRPQRFGTQSGRIGAALWSLGEIDPSVLDYHRAAMDVPPLAKAKTRLARQNALLEQTEKPNQDPKPTSTAVVPTADASATSAAHP